MGERRLEERYICETGPCHGTEFDELEEALEEFENNEEYERVVHVIDERWSTGRRIVHLSEIKERISGE